jgi:RNA polymerase sigma-70 factor (ECF subfamily)
MSDMPMTANLESMWREHHSAVTRYLAKRVDVDYVDDLAQDTFLRAWLALLRGEIVRNPVSWLYQIAHNLVIDFYRQRHEQVSTDAIAHLPSDDASPAQQIEFSADVAAVDVALRKLPPDQAEVLCLRFLEERSVADVAGTMQRTTLAVKSLQHRALTALKESVHVEPAPRDARTHLERILAAFTQHGPLTVKELATATGIARQTLYTYLYGNPHLITRLGLRYYGRVEICVWGLANKEQA